MTPAELDAAYWGQLVGSLMTGHVEKRQIMAMLHWMDSNKGRRLSAEQAAESWVWSDLHLNHGAIISAGGRPFGDTTTMRGALLAAWRERVREDELIISLGISPSGHGSRPSTRCWARCHEELGPLAAKLLEVPDDAIRTALELELAEGTVVADTVADTPCGFLGHLYRAERAIAERLLRIAAGRLPWPGIDVERALPWVARKTGLSLAPGQAEAVRLALTSKAVVITGGPGVGKTTIVDAILASWPRRASSSSCARRPAAPRGG